MIQGEYFNSMSFHRIATSDRDREREWRTDENFRQRYQPEHHHVRSVLEDLPIDMVKNFPISDSLHLIDLGLMKRLEPKLVTNLICIQNTFQNVTCFISFQAFNEMDGESERTNPPLVRTYDR